MSTLDKSKTKNASRKKSTTLDKSRILLTALYKNKRKRQTETWLKHMRVNTVTCCRRYDGFVCWHVLVLYCKDGHVVKDDFM